MLEAVLGSRNAERVLVFLAVRGEGYAAQLARFYDTALYGIQRQLDRLEDAGILMSRKVGKTRVYSFSPRFAFRKELQALLERAIEFYPESERERLRVVRKRPRRRGKPA